MTRWHPRAASAWPLLAALLFTLIGSGAEAATVSLTAFDHELTDAFCLTPQYEFMGVATPEVDDDGNGNDWIAFLWHDAAGVVLDANLVPVAEEQVFDDLLEYGPGATLTSRNLHVKVFDIGAPVSPFDSVAVALAGNLIADVSVDPAIHDPACEARSRGPQLRQLSESRAAFYSPGANPIALPLDAFGNTEVPFHVVDRSTLALFFTAECALVGSDASYRVELRVDGAVVSPRPGGSVLCSTDGTSTEDGEISARVAGATTLDRGKHVIEVWGRTDGSSSTPSLSGTSLVAYLPEPGGAGLLASVAALGVAAACRRRRWRGGFGALLLALVFAPPPPVGAETRFVSFSDPAGQLFTTAGPASVDLNPGAPTVLTVSLPEGGGRVTVHFTAECSVSSSTRIEKAILELFIGGQSVQVIFCGSNASGSHDAWVSASTTASVDIPGKGPVSVIAQVSMNSWSSGDSIRLDEISVLAVISENF